MFILYDHAMQSRGSGEKLIRLFLIGSKSGDFAQRADKPELEQYRMMSQLDEDDKQTILKLVEKMLTNKKFKDFFAKNAEGL